MQRQQDLDDELLRRISSVRSADMRDGTVAATDRARITQTAPPRPSTIPQRGSSNPSAVVSRAQLQRGRTAFERVVGFGLLIGSIVGSVLALNGGATWPIALGALLGGVGVQALLTVVQWFYHPHVPPGLGRFTRLALWCRGLTWTYAASVLIGAGLSVAGYRAVLLDPLLGLVDRIDRLSPVGVTIGAWVLLIVVSLIVEVIPENILVE